MSGRATWWECTGGNSLDKTVTNLTAAHKWLNCIFLSLIWTMSLGGSETTLTEGPWRWDWKMEIIMWCKDISEKKRQLLANFVTEEIFMEQETDIKSSHEEYTAELEKSKY